MRCIGHSAIAPIPKETSFRPDSSPYSMNIVIGSGPAGIACAYALLQKGKEVMLIDAGIDLEAEQKAQVSRLKIESDPAAFEQLKASHLTQKITGKGLLNKLVYGSDFPYRGAEENLDLEITKTGLVPSLAVGGLSNVWGAAALPYLESDLADWPIKTEDLAPHYEEIIKITGLSAKTDDLAGMFPLYTKTPNRLDSSSQAHVILSGLKRIRPELKAAGITYGTSRLMVGPSQSNKQPCVYCGQCVYGCPYGCIYNSGDHLATLLRMYGSLLKYQSDVIVTRIEEDETDAIIHGFDRISKAPVRMEGERVFLAAGVIPTARIILKSKGLHDHPVEIKDSQYFLFPLLSIKGNKEALSEAAYTLSQIFVEIQDADISSHPVHLQIYTYSDIITKTLEAKFKLLPRALRQWFIRQLEHRLIIVQGYLHSQHSGSMKLKLHLDPATMKERLTVEGMTRAETKRLVKKVTRKIGKHFFKLGLFPIAATMELTLPGRGFHSGGSFPMKAQPGPLESDIHGRIGGATRIHVVDASIFPSIPATTITLTAMANAHRIGSGDY
jgi:choline dehydrogenase-like flavoprotein